MKSRENIDVILVDENDREIGVMEKMEAHQKALLHRAVSVFVINSKGEWLIQRRAPSKYHSGGLWSNTCCTHPLPDESTMEAGNRRLNEEMGMKCNLEYVFNFIYKIKLDNELTEHELDHVYFGVSDDLPKINKDEVEDLKYMDVDVLRADIQSFQEKYSYWFRMIFERVAEEIAIHKQ